MLEITGAHFSGDPDQEAEKMPAGGSQIQCNSQFLLCRVYKPHCHTKECKN